MSRANDFCDAVGLTSPIRRWLRDHQGDPLREDIIRALMDAFEEDCPESHRSSLQFLIIQANKQLKTVDEKSFLV